MKASKNLFHLFSAIAIVGILLIFFSCGGGGGGSGNGNGGEQSTNYNLNGLIQKGPFTGGATITIQELDENLVPTGKTYNTVINDDFGGFSIPVTLSHKYVEIIATGYYYDEVNDNLSSSTLTLRTISDLSTGESVNINILTNLARERIINLASSVFSFSAATHQAQLEILAIFNIPPWGVSNFDKMDISSPGDSNAILLAISSILQQVATSNASSPSTIVAELSQTLSLIISDIGFDGILDNQQYIDDISMASQILNPFKIKDNLTNRYSQLGQSIIPPDVENYLDCDRDGIVNIDDTDSCGFWVEIAEITSPSIYIRNIFFIDNNTGWIVGAKQEPPATGEPEQRILKTTDGGYTWGK